MINAVQRSFILLNIHIFIIHLIIYAIIRQEISYCLSFNL